MPDWNKSQFLRGCIPFYREWLRFFLDFCQKYHCNPHVPESLSPFLTKLADKGQAEHLRTQAQHAVTIFQELIEKQPSATVSAVREPTAQSSASDQENYIHTHQEVQENNVPACPGVLTTETSSPAPSAPYKSTNADWRPVFTALKAEIARRHYSPKTLRSYAGWTAKLQTYTSSKDPHLLAPGDVKAFLTHLAVERHVSASSQNQAFNKRKPKKTGTELLSKNKFVPVFTAGMPSTASAAGVCCCSAWWWPGPVLCCDSTPSGPSGCPFRPCWARCCSCC